jgi:hypothetical protein
MAHTYMLFDFGADEDKAQQARHKLEGWKQAFRLDKKLQFKFDRGEPAWPEEGASVESREDPENPAKPAKPAKSKAKGQGKEHKKDAVAAKNGAVKLLVRLYFSGHEKLSEQRWLDRIPAEAPFKGASPQIVQEGEKGFSEALARFDLLD